MLEHVFLESRLLLFAAWIVVQLGVIGWWSWRRTPAANRAVWAGLVALPCLMVLSTWVVTRGEQITQLCRGLAQVVEREELDTLKGFLADDFTAADMNRDEFIERVGSALSRFQISRLKLQRFAYEFDAGGNAAVEFSATCRVRSTDADFDRVPSRWRLNLRRQEQMAHYVN